MYLLQCYHVVLELQGSSVADHAVLDHCKPQGAWSKFCTGWKKVCNWLVDQIPILMYNLSRFANYFYRTISFKIAETLKSFKIAETWKGGNSSQVFDIALIAP